MPRQPSPLSAKIPKTRVDTRKVIENFMIIMALNSHLMTVHMGGESGLFAFFDLHFSVCFLNSLGYFAFSFSVDRIGGIKEKKGEFVGNDEQDESSTDMMKGNAEFLSSFENNRFLL